MTPRTALLASSAAASTSVERAARARAETFERLYRSINPRVERYLASVLHGTARAYAEDAAAVAWLKLAESERVNLSEGNAMGVSAWVKRAAYTSALDLQRHHERSLGRDSMVTVGPDGEEVERDLPGPDSVEDAVELRERFAEAIERLEDLSPAQRQAMLLQAAGHSYAAITSMTGWSLRQLDRALTEGRAAARAQVSEDRLFRERPLPVASRAAGERADRLAGVETPAVEFRQEGLFPEL